MDRFTTLIMWRMMLHLWLLKSYSSDNRDIYVKIWLWIEKVEKKVFRSGRLIYFLGKAEDDQDIIDIKNMVEEKKRAIHANTEYKYEFNNFKCRKKFLKKRKMFNFSYFMF